MMHLLDRICTQSGTGTGAVHRIRTVVIDDHPVLHEALAHAFQATPDVRLCGGAYSAADAAALVEAARPEVAVVDVSLGDDHGVDLIRVLHAAFPDVKIVAFSMYDELLYAERVIWAGGSGYVMKMEPMATLLKAIRTVMRDGIFLGSRVEANVQLVISDEPFVESILAVRAMLATN